MVSSSWQGLATAAHLITAPNLCSLDVASTDITAPVLISWLCSCVNSLEKLCLSNCSMLSLEPLIGQLQLLSRLQWLSIANCGVTETALTQLLSQNQLIAVLDLTGELRIYTAR